MSRYSFERNTTVVLVPSVASLAAPTLAEIAAGVDVSADLRKDGLSITRATGTVNRTPWTGNLEVEAPGRYGVQVELTGFRDSDSETLWDEVATFRERKFLVVRRGIPFGTAWAAGQVVEALEVRVGKRSTMASAPNTAVSFTVPLFVLADEDAAVVA